MLLAFYIIMTTAIHQASGFSAHSQATMSTSKKKQKLIADDVINDEQLRQIRAGFIGCGTIASAIATSLAKPEHKEHLANAGLSVSAITVTRRSESKSAKLKKDFPNVVAVFESAEEVIRNSDLVFLCVLPQQVDETLSELNEKGAWNDKHTLVSLVSTSKIEDVIAKTSLPANRVFKMICLPAISNREGCALLQPSASIENGHPYLKDMFDALGGCVECLDDEIMSAMMVPTGLMGTMYGIMRNNRDWLIKKGISPSDASYFVARSYLSMVQDAERDCKDPRRFDVLIDEQTPGGLNEQALNNQERQGVFDAYDNSMDAILSRLQGKSDGSLPK
jgi:pyrroline-5-carboxylate reductase